MLAFFFNILKYHFKSIKFLQRDKEIIIFTRRKKKNEREINNKKKITRVLCMHYNDIIIYIINETFFFNFIIYFLELKNSKWREKKKEKKISVLHGQPLLY